MSIKVWQQAFLSLVGAYSASTLMKYGQTIRDLAVRGQNGHLYDENFRYLRGTQASLVPWVSIHGMARQIRQRRRRWSQADCVVKSGGLSLHN